jgi:hypothetical protein
MGHEDYGRKIGLPAFPGVQETRGSDDLELELGMSSRIGLPEVGVEKRERSGVEIGRVLVRDRRKAQSLREVKRRGLSVDLGRLDGLDRDRLGPKESGPHYEEREKKREGRSDDDKRFSHEEREA